MRVISGVARGSTLLAPKGTLTRPTTDQVKEAFFNIVANLTCIQGCAFLDLCAGSGGMGIEALSRGADKAVFVDCSKESIAAIYKNLSKTRFEDKATVLKADIFSALGVLHRKNTYFDIIFADPPYEKIKWEEFLEQITKSLILPRGGIFTMEQQVNEPLPQYERYGFDLIKINEYANTKITLLRKAEE